MSLFCHGHVCRCMRVCELLYQEMRLALCLPPPNNPFVAPLPSTTPGTSCAHSPAPIPSHFPLENPLPSEHRCPCYRRAFGGEIQGPQGCCMCGHFSVLSLPDPAAALDTLCLRGFWDTIVFGSFLIPVGAPSVALATSSSCGGDGLPNPQPVLTSDLQSAPPPLPTLHPGWMSTGNLNLHTCRTELWKVLPDLATQSSH